MVTMVTMVAIAAQAAPRRHTDTFIYIYIFTSMHNSRSLLTLLGIDRFSEMHLNEDFSQVFFKLLEDKSKEKQNDRSHHQHHRSFLGAIDEDGLHVAGNVGRMVAAEKGI